MCYSIYVGVINFHCRWAAIMNFDNIGNDTPSLLGVLKMMKNPIGTTFKKENIFLATFDCPIDKKELDAILKRRGIDLSEYPKMVKAILGKFSTCTMQEYDIFYKDEKGYTRFLLEENETFAGDGSDGKGKLYNIVSVWKYYCEDELSEVENNAGEPAIFDETGEKGKIEKYNRDYNWKR